MQKQLQTRMHTGSNNVEVIKYHLCTHLNPVNQLNFNYIRLQSLKLIEMNGLLTVIPETKMKPFFEAVTAIIDLEDQMPRPYSYNELAIFLNENVGKTSQVSANILISIMKGIEDDAPPVNFDIPEGLLKTALDELMEDVHCIDQPKVTCFLRDYATGNKEVYYGVEFHSDNPKVVKQLATVRKYLEGYQERDSAATTRLMEILEGHLNSFLPHKEVEV